MGCASSQPLAIEWTSATKERSVKGSFTDKFHKDISKRGSKKGVRLPRASSGEDASSLHHPACHGWLHAVHPPPPEPSPQPLRAPAPPPPPRAQAPSGTW